MTPMSIHLCGLAAAVFIASSLFLAVVRWFHMCHPYDQKPDYYYPGRPIVAAFHLNALVLIPYALHPESADAWYLARLYLLPVGLFYCTIMLLSYFGSVMQWKKWLRPIVLLGGPVALAMLAALVLAVWPGAQMGTVISETAANGILYALGLLTTASCLFVMRLILRHARLVDKDDYSNPEDFPVVAARRWMVLVGMNMVSYWTAALSDSRSVMAVVMLFLSATAGVFLISILHPNRNRPMGESVVALGLEPDAVPDGEGQIYQRSLPLKKRLEILSAVTTVVEEKEAYLEPHLTLQEVAERCGYNRSYVAGLIKSEMGGFFTYVNRLRVQRVDDYLQQHPSATVQEAAEESGFVSRKAYYSAKAKLQA
jgi:AraC-like DNA-binding protein